MTPRDYKPPDTMAYTKSPGPCPKCGGQRQTGRWCAGGLEVVPDRPTPQLAYLLHAGRIQMGCMTRGEHLHVTCPKCGYDQTMRTKDDPLTWTDQVLKIIQETDEIRTKAGTDGNNNQST